jgi:thiamine biosynthesis lipoprotein
LIIDQAMAAARAAAPEASGLLLDIGGDIRVWSAPGRGLPWDLAVVDPCAFFDNAPPLQQVQLADGALAVSGQSHRRAVDGTGHVRDPRTGAAAGAPLAAVIAPTAMDADALATAFLVMSAHDALPLAGSLPGVAALMIDSQGQVRSTANWPGRPPAAACQTTRPWPRDFVLTASLDIPRHEAANYERPYVAVWITDAQRRPIRTLLMLGPEARWRESNYIYWRRVERMDLAGVARIARPTRAPGRYEVMWDGRTDAGAMAEPGAYTLNIEAAREHGGHSFVTVPLNIGQAPFQAESEAAQEIGTVRVRYGRRTDRP